MTPKSSDKIVCITGSSAGIGRETALLFAHHGNKLIITYYDDKKVGENVKQECLQAGAIDVQLIHLDLNNDESIKRAVQKIISQYHQIDILINNAGILEHGALVNKSYEEIDRQININLTGLIKLTRECLPYVKESIVNIGSELGFKGHPRLSLYCASKFGVRGFTKGLALERNDLKIYVVNPGLTATQMGGWEGMPPQKVAQVIMNAALGKYKLKNGTDINVRDYQHGPLAGKLIAKLREIKKSYY